MTFWAQRAKQNIDVHVTHGPVSIHVTEDYRHMRVFWAELGRLIGEAEKEFPTVSPQPASAQVPEGA